MPVYEVTDPNSGQTIELEGDSPPSEQELEEIFTQLGQSGGAQGQPAPEPAQAPSAAASEPQGNAVVDPITGETRQIAGVGEGFVKAAQRFGEPALTFATGALAEPLAGLVGIFQTINPFADEGAGARAVEGTREALTFQPRSEEGKIGLQDIGELAPVKAFVETLTGLEKTLGDAGFKIAGPAGGAFGATIPTAVLEGLGLVSLKKLRLGKADFIQNGAPTAELQTALKKAGMEFDDLTPEQISELSGSRVGASAEEAARKARFEEQGIPFTKGDVAQDFTQLSKEQRLLSMVTDEASEPLRQLKFQQSQAFVRNTERLVDELGGSADAGEMLKGALDGRLKLLKKEKGELYKEFADTSPELQNIPIITDTITGAIPDRATTRRIGRSVPTAAKALDDLLVEFGVDKSTLKVDEFLKAGDEITPLNIGNIDDFRQGINLIERADQTGSIQVLTGPIKRALDAEASLVDDAARAAGITDESILAPLKKARETVRQIKTEFSADALTGKLTKFKRDGVTPVIEASKAVDKVIGANVPIEHLERTLASLNKAGKDGKTAIKALQASVVFKALDDALGAPTRKTGGKETISGNAFDKSLRKFGDDRLNVLFADDPATLKKLKGLQKTAKDITPPSASVPKGSAPIIMDAIKRMERLPVAAALVKSVRFIIEAGGDERAVSKAMKANPSFKKSAKLIREDFPNLAFALGIGGVDDTIKTTKPGLSLSLEEGAE